jgi:hypothetical protein
VDTIFCSSWDECPANLWTVPAFSNVVADFLSRPLPQSTATVAATVAADPVEWQQLYISMSQYLYELLNLK